ncbi:MAG TPA: aldolase/citrate lyase family protein [Aestuariivirgaceae bacterium]|jgi:2-dehydro-3-deoxyglucarate aldolase/4-hydroxy-2-oxoheptanedioate aldolase
MVQPIPGFWLQRPNLSALELAALTGYELVVLDMEHGALTRETCDTLVAMGRALGLVVLVRVAESERILIQQALDYGATGVMLPMIRDAAHAAEASAYSKYPPLGRRGVGGGRAFDYGAYQEIDKSYHETSNSKTRCYVMIETAKALEDVDAIATLPTVDGLFIGPSDLSIARGRGAFQFASGDQEDFRRVARACKSQGKSLGLPASTPAALTLAREVGAAYVTLTDDLSAHRIGFLQARSMLGGGIGER